MQPKEFIQVADNFPNEKQIVNFPEDSTWEEAALVLSIDPTIKKQLK